MNSYFLPFGLAVMLATAAGSTSIAEEDAESCRSIFQFAGPYESGPFVVSTYHITGTPGTDRVIDLTWPKELKGPLPGVSPGRTDGAEEFIAFDFKNAMSLPDPETGERIQLPTFSISIRAADKLPLYSRMSRVAWGPIGEVIKANSGHTYVSSEGFNVLTAPSPEGWIQYSYPDSIYHNSKNNSWIRGEPTPDGVDLILRCDKGVETQRTRCHIFGKVEPVFYDFYYHTVGVGPLEEMNHFAEEFVSCLLEGF